MKKKTGKVLLGSATVAAVMAVGGNVKAATANLNVEARIVTSAALLITQTAILDFGSMVETAAGTLTVETDGGAVKTGGVTPVGGALQPGGFKIKGVNGKSVDFSMPATATIKNGTKVMIVDNFKIGTGSQAPGTFTMGLTGGIQPSIPVGARLNVNAGQTTGTYTGTVDIIPNYQ